ncbi:dihydrolipoyl dehydrogenase family protein [Tepidibacter hydrothermalis]|uniref:NAD(P)/FAD-dependent oxidoreductase n=1 Tax=Tepidibacter hydrothermalis TaxID=3036126 RepID=A0ABY8EC47_9FIRM|nr:NAD(P)/FAD-dependent oxidoreductase [Tepidibacter hydrothermalis]WFD09359.1 NAD(P)/FAD-dependent oxidoreductase [Tepidibacter hydrothermalis]
MRYDAVVIGSGAAGIYFSLSCANKGKKVAIIEKDELGGTAFATGCLPVKRFMDKIKDMKKAEVLQKQGLININNDKELLYKACKSSMDNIENFIIDKLDSEYIDVYRGCASIQSKNTVKVNEDILNTDNIIIASGTNACSLKGSCEIDEDIIMSHKGIINMKDLCDELTIIGGNVEGIEFASLFSELGVKVTVIERESEILSGNDFDLIDNIKERLVSNNVNFMLDEEVVSIEKNEEMAYIKLKSGKKIETSKVLVTGIRKPNTPIGASEIGVTTEGGYVKVDNNLRTSVDNIYAIGDINGLHGMAHIAIQQGILLVDYIYEGKNISFDYNSLPRCIFTINELAGAGLQESQLSNCSVDKIYFNETFRGFDSDNDGFIKIITKDHYIKGVWINSIDAGSLIGNIGIWIDKNISIDDIKRSLFINPTLSESLIELAVRGVK